MVRALYRPVLSHKRLKRGSGTFRATRVGRRARPNLAWRCLLLSRIFPENDPSRALCRSLGFREVGIYRRHARLDGAWKDCVIVEKLLGKAAVP